ncbi:MAG: COX15/CtaA family protein [Planctomycetota bacterium]
MPPAADNPPTEHRWLRRFTYLVILATFSLIAIGGHVTSTDVGLAVPDGFTTFGHNTLLAPLEVWWYDFGTRWEHGHRLKGMVVGMMTIIMATWLLIAVRDRPWLKWSGVVMLLLVISQGIMGALRVSEISLTLAFIHGICGQLILCSWVVIAAALSKPWISRLKATAKKKRDHTTIPLRWAVRVLLLLLLVQLTLGSAVRHFKADKAIPDFPLTYGQVIPPMSQDSLDDAYASYYSDQLGKTADETGITNRTPQGEIVVALSDVDLQFGHRVGALVVCLLGLFVIIAAIRRAGDQSIVVAPALIVLALLSTQFALGVYTVLSGTNPLMATLHQATGAILIAASTWMAVRIHLAEYAPEAVTADVEQKEPRPAAVSAPQEQRTPVTA